MNHIELIARIFSDPITVQEVEALFLFGQTADNQGSVLERAAELACANRAMPILLMQTGPLSGYPGYDVWADALSLRGVPAQKVVGIPLEGASSLNSLIEAQAAVRYAKLQGYSTLGVCAAPFHHYRAFLTAATVSLREYPQLVLGSFPGKPQPWDERVVHSQGVDRGSRSDLLTGEIKRIATYQAKGDMASFEELSNYIRRRYQEKRVTA